MKKKLPYFILFSLLGLLVFSCETGPQPLEKVIQGPLEPKVNPHGRVPLGAELSFSTTENCRVDLTIEGKQPVSRSFSAFEKFHQIPVIGLYPGQKNIVQLTLTSQKGKVYEGSVEIETPPIPFYLPDIEIKKIDRSRMEPGFHLADMLIANNGKFQTYTLMFDDDGVIRWFMDMSETGQITYTSYRLKNGNWLYLNWIDLIEVDDLGQIVRRDQMWGNAGNHEIIELANGNLLMGGSKKDAVVLNQGKAYVSRYDHVVLWDRKQNRTVKEWDMRAVLDVDRVVYPPDYTPDYQADWFHVNSIAESKTDYALLVSGRNQGVVKVGPQNELKWILAPHKSWGKAGPSGQGLDTKKYLLTAVNEEGIPYPPNVQRGEAHTEDFEWSTGQHAVKSMENGHILLFDNGLRRDFKPGPTYSRAVEYEINEEDMTIRQVWSYGKKRGLELFSPITSDVDILPTTGNMLVTAGNVRLSEAPPHATMVEITYPDKEEIFEAHIYFKDALGTKENAWAQFDLVFRGERYPLIPEE